MKRILAALLASAILVPAALAGPVGLSHQADAVAAPAARAELKLAAVSSTCAIQLRYHVATPALLEVAYFGPLAVCYQTQETAIDAAYFATPATKGLVVPGEPAATPVYECAVTVAWDPAAAASPAITPTGACPGTLGTALFEGTRAVRCSHKEGSCGP